MPKSIFSRFELGEPGQGGGELPDWGLLPISSNLYVKFSKSRVPGGTDPGQNAGQLVYR